TEAHGLLLRFYDEPVRNRQPARGLHCALRALHGEWGLRGNRGSERLHLALERVVVHEPFAQADTKGFLRVDPGGRPDHLLRLARADDAREPLRTAEVGKDAVLVLQQADRRAAREHADVARERALQTRAQRVTADGGDRRITRLLEPRVRGLRAKDAVDRR